MSNKEGPEWDPLEENQRNYNSDSNFGNNVNYGNKNTSNNNNNANNNTNQVRLAKGASNQNYNKKEKNRRNLKNIIKKHHITKDADVKRLINKMYTLTNISANTLYKATGIKFNRKNMSDIIATIGRKVTFKPSERYQVIDNMTRGKIPLNKQAFLNFYKNDGEKIYNKVRLSHMRNGILPMNKNTFINLYKKVNAQSDPEVMYNLARYNLMKKLRMKPNKAVFEKVANAKYKSIQPLTNIQEILLTNQEKANRIPNYLGQYMKEYNNLTNKYNKLVKAAKKPIVPVPSGPFKRPTIRKKATIKPSSPKPKSEDYLSILNRSLNILYKDPLMNSNLNYRVNNKKKVENIEIVLKLRNLINSKNKNFQKVLKTRRKVLSNKKDLSRVIKNYLETNSLHLYLDKRLLERLGKIKYYNFDQLRKFAKIELDTKKWLGKLPKNFNINAAAKAKANENYRRFWTTNKLSYLPQIIDKISSILYPTKVMLNKRKYLLDKSPTTIRVLNLFINLSDLKIFQDAYKMYPFKHKLRNKKLNEIVKDAKDYLRISKYKTGSLTNNQRNNIARVLNGIFLSKENKQFYLQKQQSLENMLMLAVAPDPNVIKNKALYNQLKNAYAAERIKMMEQKKILVNNKKTINYIFEKLKNYIPKPSLPKYNKFPTKLRNVPTKQRKSNNKFPKKNQRKTKWKPTLAPVPELVNIGLMYASYIPKKESKAKNLPKPPSNYKPKATDKKQKITFKKPQRDEKMDLIIEALKRLEMKNDNKYINLPEEQASVIAYKVVKSNNPKQNLVNSLENKEIKYTQNNVNGIMKILNKPDFNKNFTNYVNSSNLRTTTPRNIIKHMTERGHTEENTRTAISKMIQQRRQGKEIPENKETALKKGFSEDAWKKAQRALRGEINVVKM